MRPILITINAIANDGSSARTPMDINANAIEALGEPIEGMDMPDGAKCVLMLIANDAAIFCAETREQIKDAIRMAAGH
jgi:hypothetical protein